MVIAGAKGFAKEITIVAEECFTDKTLFFFDDTVESPIGKLFDKYEIIRSEKELVAHFKTNGFAYVLGVGSPRLRKLLYEKINILGGEIQNIISTRSIIGKNDNILGNGIVVMPNAIIESSNKIGLGCLIHTQSLISHDCIIGNFCEISPGAKILGNVTIGNSTSVGTNATILPGFSIGNNVVVGAGAVVTSNIPDNAKVAGVPAKSII